MFETVEDLRESKEEEIENAIKSVRWKVQHSCKLATPRAKLAETAKTQRNLERRLNITKGLRTIEALAEYAAIVVMGFFLIAALMVFLGQEGTIVRTIGESLFNKMGTDFAVVIAVALVTLVVSYIIERDFVEDIAFLAVMIEEGILEKKGVRQVARLMEEAVTVITSERIMFLAMVRKIVKGQEQ